MNAVLRFIISILCLVGLFAISVYFLFPAPCRAPLAYSIGQVDPEFYVSREDFLKDIQDAETVWEKEAGKELFSYTPNAPFTVNLIYDQRQQATDTANSLSNNLSDAAGQRKTTKQEYDQLYARYKEKEKQYEQHVAEYEKTGGEEQFTALDTERIALNNLAAQVNAVAQQDSTIVKTYNANVLEFNTLFSGKREFDQGEYVGNAINIYEFSKHDDLLLVLEHELGHALGIGHVEGKKSVMYYVVNKENILSQGLSAEDKQALSETCKKTSFAVFTEKLQRSPYWEYTQEIIHNYLSLNIWKTHQ